MLQISHCQAFRRLFSTGSVFHLWATPILTARPKNRKDFNKALTKIALEQYDRFVVEHNNSPSKEADADEQDINSAFYEWQAAFHDKAGLSVMTGPIYQELLQLLSQNIMSYLTQIGKQHLVEPSNIDIFAWASVHPRGSCHLSHVHPGSLVSGVYYSQVPEGAGSLLLEDPRGPLPPFNSRFTLQPKEGDLIIFPSWLSHQVSPTSSRDPRISWSFNVLDGDWSQTAAIMVSME